ncbi:hypothetical protein, partial [Cryptosporangium japonicum]|uniref:hypothetical protein n=1 Tax=Cryptosporangium japonicum TaxID=80872 RepID=UPI0031D7E1FB
AVEQYRTLAAFAQKTGLQVEYVKLISILSLVELLIEIAWAVAMAFWTGGGSMVWLAARYAIFRFLLKTLLGRLIMKILASVTFGVLLQVAMDVAAQAIQFAKGSRTEWDSQATLQSVYVGLMGAAVSLPLGPMAELFEKGLANVLQKISRRAVPDEVIAAAVEKAAKHLEEVGSEPLEFVAPKIVKSLDSVFGDAVVEGWAKQAGKSATEVVQESLHEMLTETLLKGAMGQGWEVNPFSATAGAS